MFSFCVVLLLLCASSFFFNDTATTEIYTLSLHDALPISYPQRRACGSTAGSRRGDLTAPPVAPSGPCGSRSEEHTSELQSHSDLVCRLLLEKKKKKKKTKKTHTNNIEHDKDRNQQLRSL